MIMSANLLMSNMKLIRSHHVKMVPIWKVLPPLICNSKYTCLRGDDGLRYAPFYICDFYHTPVGIKIDAISWILLLYNIV